MKKIILYRFTIPIILICISLIPLIDLFHTGLPVTHDGKDHVARIANFYQNLSEGTLIPRWAPNLNWGYGHPILMFLYPLPSYTASVFHNLGFSFVDSTKMVFIIAYILSSLTMYIWLSVFLPRNAAFIGSLLYIFAPYRFVDLYVRGAIGEHVAFIFPPLIFYAILMLSKSKAPSPWTIMGAISLACLILSHNAISLMFLPLIFLYILYLLLNSKHNKYFILNTLYIILMGFALSAFFWLPALAEGKYTLRDIVTQGGFEKNFGSLSQLIYGPWNYGISGQFTLQIGILHWIGIVVAVPLCIYLFVKRNKLWPLICGLLIIFSISLFLIEKNSQFIWEKITLIQKFQFPWRFLTISVFTSSVLGALVFAHIPKKITAILTIFLIILILLLNIDYWHPQGYLNKPESFYTSIYSGTTDTGESAPIWSVRFMEETPKSHIEVISGKAKVTEKKRTSVFHNYIVSAPSRAQLRENTLYFPGWQVLIDGKQTDIQFQDANNRGVMTFFIDKGTHDIKVIFKETTLRLTADIISGVSFIILILFFITNKLIKSRLSRSKR